MNSSSKLKRSSSKLFWVTLSVGVFLVTLYFSKGSTANEGALIREMRVVSKQHSKYQHNLDDVVLKHIPLGTPSNVAFAVCQKNGFQAARHRDMRGADYPGFEEYIYCTQEEARWFLIFTEEYRVVLYLKNNQVGAVIGRFFIHSI